MRSRRALPFAVVVFVSSLAAGQAGSFDAYLSIPEGGGPVDVGPVPDGLSSVDALACRECHASAYREWAQSRHRSSFDDPIFRREFDVRGGESCARCHAPRPAHSGDGVDCATCHVRDGFVLNPTVSGRAPHRSRETPELNGVLACARCHEFDFGSRSSRQQSTLSEWTASLSGAREETCQRCHLPREGTRHRHDLPGIDDPATLGSAVRVRGRAIRTEAGTRAVFQLRARRVGHAVPTGDFFRSLVVRAWPDGRPEQAQTAQLRRRFGPEGLIDERLPPPPDPGRTLTLELPAADRVRFAVELWLMRPRDMVEGGFTEAEARRTIARGVLETFPSTGGSARRQDASSAL